MITIFSANLPEPSSIGTEKTTYEFPAGTLDYEHPLSNVAEDHEFILNGETYICNDLVDGNTKIKVAYKEEGLDVIALEMMRSDGSVKIIIRHNIISSQAGDPFKLIYNDVTPVEPKILGCIVRFKKDKACLVTYDEGSDEFNVEVI